MDETETYGVGKKIIDKILVVGEKHSRRLDTELKWAHILERFDDRDRLIFYIHEPTTEILGYGVGGRELLPGREISNLIAFENTIETEGGNPLDIVDKRAFTYFTKEYTPVPKSLSDILVKDFMDFGSNKRSMLIWKAEEEVRREDTSFFWSNTAEAKKLEEFLGPSEKTDIDILESSRHGSKKLNYVDWRSHACHANWYRLSLNRNWCNNLFKIIEVRHTRTLVNVLVIVGNAHMGSQTASNWRDQPMHMEGMIALLKKKEYSERYSELMWGWETQPRSADRFTDRGELNIQCSVVSVYNAESDKTTMIDINSGEPLTVEEIERYFPSGSSSSGSEQSASSEWSTSSPKSEEESRRPLSPEGFYREMREVNQKLGRDTEEFIKELKGEIEALKKRKRVRARVPFLREHRARPRQILSQAQVIDSDTNAPKITDEETEAPSPPD